jgi:hypothetical protein
MPPDMVSVAFMASLHLGTESIYEMENPEDISMIGC